MSPILSSEGEKVNWVNYKTGEKHVHIKMTVADKKARIGIEFSHPEPDVQEIFFHHLERLRETFADTAGSDWQWQLHIHDEGRLISRVSTSIENVMIFRKEDWPDLISFFKPRMIALDEFWNLVKHSFEQVR